MQSVLLCAENFGKGNVAYPYLCASVDVFTEELANMHHASIWSLAIETSWGKVWSLASILSALNFVDEEKIRYLMGKDSWGRWRRQRQRNAQIRGRQMASASGAAARNNVPQRAESGAGSWCWRRRRIGGGAPSNPTA